MTTYIDTYLKSKSKEALDALQTYMNLVIEVKQGRSAFIDENGIEHSAAGDSNYWYTCIRSIFSIPAIDQIEACSEDEGKSVVGVWA